MAGSTVPKSLNESNSQDARNVNENSISPPVMYTHCNKSDDANHPFTVFHQNMQGLKNKIDELMLTIDSEMPHLICITEHHLNYTEIDVAYIPNYNLAAKYCRTSLKCGGVCIYIHKNLKYTNINLLKYCKEQDLEIVAVNLKFSCKNVIILCTYRSPGGNLMYFLDKLDTILNSLENLKTEFIICGDFNINYIGINNKKNSIRKPVKHVQLDWHDKLPHKNHYYVLLSYR